MSSGIQEWVIDAETFNDKKHENRIGKLARETENDPIWRGILFLAIVGNAVTIILYRHKLPVTDPFNIGCNTAENVWTVIFLLDSLLLCVSRGLFREFQTNHCNVKWWHPLLGQKPLPIYYSRTIPPIYKSPWDIFAILVSAVGVAYWIVVSIILRAGGAATPALATAFGVLRVLINLRLLFVVRIFPGARRMLESYGNNLLTIMHITLLVTSIVLIFATVGVYLFRDAMHWRCLAPVLATNSSEALLQYRGMSLAGWADAGHGRLCTDPVVAWDGNATMTLMDAAASSASALGGHTCPEGLYCVDVPQTPNNGVTSFDNVGNAFLTVFQAMSMEGWTQVMYFTMDAVSPVAALYWLLVIFVCNMMMLGLFNDVTSQSVTETAKQLDGPQLAGPKVCPRWLTSSSQASSLASATHPQCTSPSLHSPSQMGARARVQTRSKSLHKTHLSPISAAVQFAVVWWLLQSQWNPVDELRARLSVSPGGSTSPDPAAPTPARSPASSSSPSSGSEVDDSLGLEVAATPTRTGVNSTLGQTTLFPGHSVDPRARRHLWLRIRVWFFTLVYSAPSSEAPPVPEYLSIAQRELLEHRLQPPFQITRGRNDQFERVVTLALLFNALLMAFHFEGMSNSMAVALDQFNRVFTVVFTVELACRLLGLGWVPFLARGLASWLDILVVTTSWVEMIFGFFTEGQLVVGINTLRTLRLLRVAMLAKQFKGVSELVNALGAAVRRLSNLLLLLVVFLFEFAVIGTYLFGSLTSYSIVTGVSPPGDVSPLDEGGVISDPNFSTVGWAFFTVYQFFTTLNESKEELAHQVKPALKEELARVDQQRDFVFTYMQQPVLQGRAEGVRAEGPFFMADCQMYMELINQQRYLLQEFGTDGIEYNAPRGGPGGQGARNLGGFATAAKLVSNSLKMKDSLLDEHTPHPYKRYEEYLKTLPEFLTHPVHKQVRMPTRRTLRSTLEGPAFRWFCTIVIVLSLIVLWVDPEPILSRIEANSTTIDQATRDRYPEFAATHSVCLTLDWVAAVFFMVELVLAMAAKGAEWTSDGYVWLNLVVVLGMVLNLLPIHLADPYFVQAIIRPWRGLRPLLLISHIWSVRKIATSIVMVLPSMVQIALLAVLLMYILAVVGVQQFGELFPVVPDQYTAGFNNVPVAYQSLYELISQEGWPSTAYTFIGAALTKGWNPVGCALFFMLITFIGLFINNFIISPPTLMSFRPFWAPFSPFIRPSRLPSLLPSLLKERIPENIQSLEGLDKLTPRLQRWYQLMVMTSRARPRRLPLEPGRPGPQAYVLTKSFVRLRQAAFRVVHGVDRAERSQVVDLTVTPGADPVSAKRDLEARIAMATKERPDTQSRLKESSLPLLIKFVILVNFCVYLLAHRGQTAAWQDVFRISAIVFTTIYALEAALKLLADGAYLYFTSGWNIFDFCVVCLSIVDLFLFNTPNTGALRLLRLVQIARILHFTRQLGSLFGALKTAMPRFLATGLLLVIFLVAFATSGMYLWGDLQAGQMLDHGNVCGVWLCLGSERIFTARLAQSVERCSNKATVAALPPRATTRTTPFHPIPSLHPIFHPSPRNNLRFPTHIAFVCSPPILLGLAASSRDISPLIPRSTSPWYPRDTTATPENANCTMPTFTSEVEYPSAVWGNCGNAVWGRLFWMVFFFCCGWILLNVFTAVLMDAQNETREENRRVAEFDQRVKFAFFKKLLRVWGRKKGQSVAEPKDDEGGADKAKDAAGEDDDEEDTLVSTRHIELFEKTISASLTDIDVRWAHPLSAQSIRPFVHSPARLPGQRFQAKPSRPHIPATQIWKKYDPYATGFIPALCLRTFLVDLAPPLGCNPDDIAFIHHAGIPFTVEYYVPFRELLRILVTHAYFGEKYTHNTLLETTSDVVRQLASAHLNHQIDLTDLLRCTPRRRANQLLVTDYVNDPAFDDRFDERFAPPGYVSPHGKRPVLRWDTSRVPTAKKVRHALKQVRSAVFSSQSPIRIKVDDARGLSTDIEPYPHSASKIHITRKFEELVVSFRKRHPMAGGAEMTPVPTAGGEIHTTVEMMTPDDLIREVETGQHRPAVPRRRAVVGGDTDEAEEPVIAVSPGLQPTIVATALGSEPARLNAPQSTQSE
ncbi:putative Ion transport protein [Paratrimastix pyriformis]|uniref:Ion transport protein n=1 Tax=Paratrimastix pyriformis TaxID=342808 RepID=A0ABQ8UFL8_9EUKA|nr:putative Ion transport protein [Paratrimastix pyriformis]